MKDDIPHFPVRRALQRVAAATLPLLQGFVFSSVSAQVAAPSPAASAPSATVVPIQVPDILSRADEDQQRVDWAKRLLVAQDPLDRLRRSLDEIARPVDAKMRAMAGGTLHELPVMRLESLARHWEFDARRFERWEAEARRALTPYTDSALQLAQRRAAWSATQAEGLLDNLPPTLSGRIDAMLGEIDTAEAQLGAPLARQFELQQRANALKTRIDGGRKEVAEAIDDIDRRLLQVDAPPLWIGLGPRADSKTAWAAIDRGLEIERQFAIDYNAASTGNQQALRVLQILMLPLILWLVIRARHAGSDAAVPQRVTQALNRPLSAWLLLSMLSVLVLEPNAPLLVQEFALLIALVPVARLLPVGTLRALGVWPYVAITFYILDRLGAAAVADVGLYRLFMLCLTGMALGLTIWLLRKVEPTAGHNSALQRAMRPVGWAVLALLAVAAASNVAGNVSLAAMLTSGVIDSGYMALLLDAAVAASLGIFRALLGQPELSNRRLVHRHGPVFQLACTRLLVLGASLGWLLYTLDRFRLLRPLHGIGAEVLAFGIDVGEVSIHLGDVLAFAISVWLAVWAARGIRRLMRDELPGYAGLPRGVGNSIASLSYYCVLLLGMLIALSAAGFKVSQLALVFGALGVGIGFGLQNVVNNFVSGLVLMFERPIQPGDIVEAAGSAGTVREIGLRATTIRTFDGADVVVPNGLLLSGNLTNWTMFDRSRRIEAPVDVAYGSDPAQVLSVMQAAARETPGVAEQPAPVAQMTGYGDSALHFVVRAWTHDYDSWGAVRSELLARTLAALGAAGISIPYNQLDLHVRSVPEQMDAFSDHLKPSGPKA